MTAATTRISNAKSRLAAKFAATRGPLIYWPLVLVIVVAVVLRVAAMVTYWPANLWPPDSVMYLNATFRSSLFSLHTEGYPLAGYPNVLAFLHAIWPSAGFTIAFQHLLGLATGAFWYLTARRFGVPRLLATLVMAVVVFDGVQLYFENSFMSEPLFGFLIAGGMYMAVRAVDGHWHWAAGSGLFLGYAVTTRSAAIAVPLVVGLWLLIFLKSSRRKAIFVVLAAALVMGSYAVVNRVQNGITELSNETGYTLYSRIAEFADCGKFKPPSITLRLCELGPKTERLGPTWYHFDAESPLVAWNFQMAEQNFTYLERQRYVRQFAIAASKAQPLEYLNLLLRDGARYLLGKPDDSRIGTGDGYSQFRFGLSDENVEQQMRERLKNYYNSSPIAVKSPKAVKAGRNLTTYQDWIHIRNPYVAVTMLIGMLAVILGPRRVRWGAVLVIAITVSILLMSDIAIGWRWRYVVPEFGALALAAVLGITSLMHKWQAGRFQFMHGFSSRGECAVDGLEDKATGHGPEIE